MPIVFLDFDGVLHPEHCHESKHFIDPAGIIHEAA